MKRRKKHGQLLFGGQRHAHVPHRIRLTRGVSAVQVGGGLHGQAWQTGGKERRTAVAESKQLHRRLEATTSPKSARTPSFSRSPAPGSSLWPSNLGALGVPRQLISSDSLRGHACELCPQGCEMSLLAMRKAAPSTRLWWRGSEEEDNQRRVGRRHTGTLLAMTSFFRFFSSRAFFRSVSVAIKGFRSSVGAAPTLGPASRHTRAAKAACLVLATHQPSFLELPRTYPDSAGPIRTASKLLQLPRTFPPYLDSFLELPRGLSGQLLRETG